MSAAKFQLKYNVLSTIPVITVTDSIIFNVFPDLRTDTSVGASTYTTMVEDTTSWILTVSDLTTAAVNSISFDFRITLPPFQHEFEAANIECNFLDDSDVVVLTASTITVGAFHTSELPTSLNTLTVSSSETETGKAAELTLSYTTLFDYLYETSWFYITIPKANVDYSSESGQYTSLISSADAALATVTIGGTSLS